MANEIGVIKVILGTVTATATDGSIRTLHVGDKVSAFDLISTGITGAVEIEFNDGRVMDLGRNSQVFLDNVFFDSAENVIGDTNLSAAEIQAAILAGKDPTDNSESTASGVDSVLADDGHSSVYVEFLSEDIFPEVAGFETQTISASVPVNFFPEDNLLNFANTQTEQINVTGDSSEDESETILKSPIVTISVASQSAVSGTINIDNVKATDEGFTVTAKNINGEDAEISQVTTLGGKVNGFGVASDAGKDGAASEVQQADGKSEIIVVTFDTPVNDVSISFSWLSKVESAHYVLKDINGNIIGEGTVTGVTDNIDDAISVTGKLIASIEFTAPGIAGGGSIHDDYLINQISYTSGTVTPLTVSAQLDNLTENISEILVDVPDQAVLSVGTLIRTHDGISTWSLPLSGSEDYSINIDQTTGILSVSGLSVVMPSTFTDVLTVSVSVSVEGAGQTAEGVANALIGTSDNDSIVGADSNDTLLGNSGNDILIAGAGDDILIGGLGDDILSGGTGSDTFIWSSGQQGTINAPAIDTLTDFSSEDTLDLANLLVGEESSNLFNYITLVQQGADIVLHVSPDSSGEVTQSIVLEDTTVTELGLTGTSQAELLQQMIDKGQLHVD